MSPKSFFAGTLNFRSLAFETILFVRSAWAQELQQLLKRQQLNKTPMTNVVLITQGWNKSSKRYVRLSTDCPSSAISPSYSHPSTSYTLPTLKLFDDTKLMDKLFEEIAISIEAETNPKDPDRISMVNLITFNTTKKNPLFTSIVKDASILYEAHNFACKKKHMENDENQLPRSRFKLLLCCIFYFSMLWDIFHASENENTSKVLSDDKVHL